MLTMQEYLDIAHKIIIKNRLSKMINNDDAISYIAGWIMKADIKYNPAIGTINGFRKIYAQFGIKTWHKINSSKRKKFANSMTQLADEFLINAKSQDNVLQNILVNEILDYIKTFPEQKQKIFHMYFYDKQTKASIGRQIGMSTENVRLIINSILKKIKEKFHDK